MKKLLSLALTLAMLCCMATTTFAAKTTVVGPGDGVTDWPADLEDSTYKIDVQVNTNDVVHKYAVDVEYDATAVSIAGDTLTWNVNTMKYDITPGLGAAGNTSAPIEKEVTVINRSDRSIYAKMTIVPTYGDAPYTASATDEDGDQEIVKATAGVSGIDLGNGSGNGKEATGVFNIVLTPDNVWSDVAAYLAGVTNEEIVTIATATLVISNQTINN